MSGLAWIFSVAFLVMSGVALRYKVRAERAEEWVWFIQSEVERLVREDEESEA